MEEGIVPGGGMALLNVVAMNTGSPSTADKDVVEAAVRAELAEDLTARALERCVPLLHRDSVPEHIRAFTSQHVLDVESDIAGRLAVRGAEPGHDDEPALVAPTQATGRGLDSGQSAAVAALASDRSLVLIEGAAGAGKTTTLAATSELLTAQGHALVVVTPTLKAAKAARAEVGGQAGSGAWLAFQHGWRWDGNGTWTRLAAGQPDPVTGRAYNGPDERAKLRAGDLCRGRSRDAGSGHRPGTVHDRGRAPGSGGAAG